MTTIAWNRVRHKQQSNKKQQKKNNQSTRAICARPFFNQSHQPNFALLCCLCRTLVQGVQGRSNYHENCPLEKKTFLWRKKDIENFLEIFLPGWSTRKTLLYIDGIFFIVLVISKNSVSKVVSLLPVAALSPVIPLSLKNLLIKADFPAPLLTVHEKTGQRK